MACSSNHIKSTDYLGPFVSWAIVITLYVQLLETGELKECANPRKVWRKGNSLSIFRFLPGVYFWDSLGRRPLEFFILGF